MKTATGNIITEQEAKEAGVKQEVFQAWADVMQALWTSSIFFYEAQCDKTILPRNEENEIFLGDRFKLNAHMINNHYVEACLHEGEIELAKVRFTGNVNPICQCLFLILKEKLER